MGSSNRAELLPIFPLDMTNEILSHLSIIDIAQAATINLAWAAFCRTNLELPMSSRQAVTIIMSLSPGNAYDFIHHVLRNNGTLEKLFDPDQERAYLNENIETMSTTDAWDVLLLMICGPFYEALGRLSENCIEKALAMVRQSPGIDQRLLAKLTTSINSTLYAKYGLFDDTKTTHITEYLDQETYTNLSGTTLFNLARIGIDLRNVIILFTSISDSIFDKISLRDAKLIALECQRVTFNEVDFSGANLANAAFKECTFISPIFSPTTILIGADMPDEIKQEAARQGAILSLEDLLERFKVNAFAHPEVILKDACWSSIVAHARRVYEQESVERSRRLMEDVTHEDQDFESSSDPETTSDAELFSTLEEPSILAELSDSLDFLSRKILISPGSLFDLIDSYLASKRVVNSAEKTNAEILMSCPEILDILNNYKLISLKLQTTPYINIHQPARSLLSFFDMNGIHQQDIALQNCLKQRLLFYFSKKKMLAYFEDVISSQALLINALEYITKEQESVVTLAEMNKLYVKYMLLKQERMILDDMTTLIKKLNRGDQQLADIICNWKLTMGSKKETNTSTSSIGFGFFDNPAIFRCIDDYEEVASELKKTGLKRD